MEKGNILLITGIGNKKASLIEKFLTDNSKDSFNLLEFVVKEDNFLTVRKEINRIKNWSKEALEAENKRNQINGIWLWMEEPSEKTLKKLLNVANNWNDAPLILVFEKGYPKKELNHIKELRKFREKRALNLASQTPKEGLLKLIEITEKILPQGFQAGERQITRFHLLKKRRRAQKTLGGFTAAAVVIGAVPIPIADGLILTPLEMAMVKSLGKIYNINENRQSENLFKTIVEVGTVGLAAKTAISGLKAIPGINLGAALVNAVVAGSIVAALGQGCIYAFEKIASGEKSPLDLGWVNEVMEEKLSANVMSTVKVALSQVTKKSNKKEIAKIISRAINSKSSKEKPR